MSVYLLHLKSDKRSWLLKPCFAQILWTLLKWLEGILMQRSGMSNCWMLRPDRSDFSLIKWPNFDGFLQVYIDTGGEEKAGPTPEQMKLRVPRRPSWQGLSPEQLKEVYFRPNLKLNLIAIFRRKTRTFWTGEESWPYFRRRLGLWWLLMRRTWSSGDSCGELSSAVMSLSR